MLTRAKLLEIQKLKFKTERLKQGRFVIEGYKMIRDCMLMHPEKLEMIIISPDQKLDFEIQQIPCYTLDLNGFKRISNLVEPPGWLAVCKLHKPVCVPPQNPQAVTLYLDDIRDPGNFGTLLRLADWFGHTLLIASEHSCDVFNPKAIQASMGACFRVDVIYCALSEIINTWDNMPVIGAQLHGENLFNSKLPPKSILVLGNESKGIDIENQRLITHSRYIPALKSKGSESLNVAVAASVFLTELHRTDLKQSAFLS
jgi:TrmH family RNA methyltransferase